MVRPFLTIDVHNAFGTNLSTGNKKKKKSMCPKFEVVDTGREGVQEGRVVQAGRSSSRQSGGRSLCGHVYDVVLLLL